MNSQLLQEDLENFENVQACQSKQSKIKKVAKAGLISLGVVATLAVVGFANTDNQGSLESTDVNGGFQSLISTGAMSLQQVFTQGVSSYYSTSSVLDNLVTDVIQAKNEDTLKVVQGYLFQPGTVNQRIMWETQRERLAKDTTINASTNPKAVQIEALRKDIGTALQTYLKSGTQVDLDALLNLLKSKESLYIDTATSQIELSYFTQMSTIYLTAYRENVLKQTTQTRESVQAFNDKVDQYVNLLTKYIPTLENDRRALIQFTSEIEDQTTQSIVYSIKDKDGYVYKIGSSSKDNMDKTRAENLIANKVKSDIMSKYYETVDAVIAPAFKLRSLKLALPKTLKLYYSAPYAKGISYQQFPFSDEPLITTGGPITKVITRAGSRIDALQFQYGTVLGPNHGGNGGNRYEFSLKPDEKIVKVELQAGDALDGITYTTSTGARYQYGGYGGSYNVALPPVAGAYLAGIKGLQGTGSVEQVTLIWARYE